MDAAYTDKLDGKITDDFWQRKMSEWQLEEQQTKMALDGLASAETSDRALDAEKLFKLANRAYCFYLSQDSTDNAKLLRMMCSNFTVDAVGATPYGEGLRLDLRKCQIGRMVGLGGRSSNFRLHYWRRDSAHKDIGPIIRY